MTHNSILALDTSTDTGLVVLITKGRIFSRLQKEAREHNRFLLAMINEVLAEAELELSAVDTFMAGVGPGSFVGVRLAVSIIQGLAYALQKPVYPLSSLALQAQAFFRKFPHYQHIALAHDARMQAVYLGTYRRVSDVAVLEQPERLWRLSEQHQNVEMQAELVVGSGAHLLTPLLKTALISTEGVGELCAQDLAVLAVYALEHGKSLRPELLQPAYLQDEGQWVKLKS